MRNSPTPRLWWANLTFAIFSGLRPPKPGGALKKWAKPYFAITYAKAFVGEPTYAKAFVGEPTCAKASVGKSHLRNLQWTASTEARRSLEEVGEALLRHHLR